MQNCAGVGKKCQRPEMEENMEARGQGEARQFVFMLIKRSDQYL